MLADFLAGRLFITSSMVTDNLPHQGQGRVFADTICNLTGGNTKYDAVRMEHGIMDASGFDLTIALRMLYKMSPLVVRGCAFPPTTKNGRGMAPPVNCGLTSSYLNCLRSVHV